MTSHEVPRRWRTIDDVPGFPVATFADLQRELNAGRYTLGIDPSVANLMAPRMASSGRTVVTSTLMYAPFLAALGCLIAAVALREYLLLIGLPIAAAAFLLANPLNPLKRLMSLVFWLVLLVFAAALVWNYYLLAGITGVFLVPFITMPFLYAMNSSLLLEKAREVEDLFLFLLERGALSMRDNSTGQVVEVSSPPPVTERRGLPGRGA
jgi:uncharacterized protein (DUF697 family)